MTLLFPLGLLALAAWLIPLLVHLARRQQLAPLPFAALRWLRAQARPRQRIRLDEWPLLVVRLLLLAALALLLARPVLLGGDGAARPVVAVAPGLPLDAVGVLPRDADARWLAPGFAALDTPAPAAAQPLSSLLRELDQQLPAGAPLTVYLPDPMTGADGERPRLSRPVQWRPLAREATAPPAPASRAPRLHLGAPVDAPALRVLNAVQQAWRGQPLPPPDARVPAEGQIGVWLSPAPLPPRWQAWLQAGGTLLAAPGADADAREAVVVLRDAQGLPVLREQRVGQGRLLRFSAALSPARLPILQDADFPRRLAACVQPVAAPQWVAAGVHAPLTGARAPAPPPRPLAPWLLVLIVLLFALERWLATAARRAGSA
ncbi:BatA domain-containing protein [Stenotrophomonas sp.]|uniref:BatA domain-containing protein n=1 Tax=Stenotrophomonas sp. TaxID=69392 RepID=UPI002FC89C9E